ncbi:MAG: molybdenum cofactor biosynthesis protein MoaE [Lewinellaceae bacterium]|nr:molybdenum cofactor biosynthesis protein MoaE [Lewinellaceae bacterium]
MPVDIDIRLSKSALNVQDCLERVTQDACGGINVFIGTVRDHTNGKKVVQLQFESYEPMALREMKKIAHDAARQWPLEAISIHHRTGTLQVGDIAVIIAVSAAHRDAAFTACHYAIDTLKESVPIWKKELFEDGEVWVAAHP